MNLLRSIAAVVRFEGYRSLSKVRFAWWVLLVSFPPALLGLVRYNMASLPSADDPRVAVVVYALCAGVVSMLGVLLWAAPAVAAELELRSWVYLAVRPQGALAVLLGKYLVAVAWTVPAGLLGAAAGILVISPGNPGQLFWVEGHLVVLSCLAYAAAFALVGVLFPKRAMVACVFYAVLLEVVLAWIPAAVNLLTIQFRLRCLLVRWMEWDRSMVDDNPVFVAYFGDETAAWHEVVLLAMTAGLLATAALVLRWKEFTADAESDV